ncbi:hypothetical protein [Aureimonas glaciei]|uniref:Uncharacterized protein n=1 Tax=Aureimonas glaciei TaxID=1776957 RepID=A0A916Y062_9HYPH|nr:hypothetical protein [Aureimonas glaciei]GGD24497.1 hypothetical protein GCM10011335_29240 [Aureimonas glaciei]
MPLTNDEIKALLEAVKVLAGALDRQIPAGDTPPPTTSMWPNDWTSIW